MKVASARCQHMTPTRLTGKFALITGASRGIGRAVAERFAAEGATVAINHAHDEAGANETRAALVKISKESGHGAPAHRIEQADVSSSDAVTAMIGRVVKAWGRLDILVNNAGIQSETPGDSFDDAAVERILAVNLLGAARCARAALAHFATRPGGGIIINTSSVHEIVPKPGYLAYSMSKGGMGNLTRTLALEFVDKGVRVNGVGPGATLTDLNKSWADDPRAKAAVESHIPMGRAATSEELAPIYAFLASDDASYITGQTIFACGGLTLYGDFKKNWSS
jgi:glucose 1-dehydrogenase